MQVSTSQDHSYDESSRALLQRLDSIPLSKPHFRLRRLGGFGYLFDTFDGTLMGYAMAQSPAELFIWRVLAGIGLGAESVLVTPYLTEFVPPKHRSTFIGRTVAFFSYGSVLAGVVALLVIGPNADTWWGWRVAGLIAVLPIFALLILRRRLPESPRFLLAHGRLEEAEEVVRNLEIEAGVDPDTAAERARILEGDTSTAQQLPPAPARHAGGIRGQIKMLFAPGMVRRTLTIWLLWFTLTGVNYGFTSWMVNMLIAAKGFSVGGSFAFALVTSVAQIPGYLFAAWLAGKFEKKLVIAAYAACACIAALGVAIAPNPALLLLSAALLAAFINGAAAAYYPYTAELYPTAARTTGVGFASSAGRIGAISSPIAIGFVFAAHGFQVVFLGLVGVLALAVAMILIFGERTGGRSLEDIEGTVR